MEQTMANDRIVSVPGIRGIIGAGLSPGPALAFAAALGTYHQGGRVVLCRDSRPSGLVLRHAVLAGLLGAGCDVIDLGVAPTPTCGLAVTRLGAAGAIQITASHNPAPWNGLKLFGADGAVLSAANGAIVRMLYETGTFEGAAWNGIGGVHGAPDVQDEHASARCEQVSVGADASHGVRVL